MRYYSELIFECVVEAKSILSRRCYSTVSVAHYNELPQKINI